LNKTATRLTRGLAAYRVLHHGETSGVAARSCEAINEAATDRIANNTENDGDGVRLMQQRGRRRCVLRKNEVGL
jgi:hypothetical protein